jgi:hypothetical protein
MQIAGLHAMRRIIFFEWIRAQVKGTQSLAKLSAEPFSDYCNNAIAWKRSKTLMKIFSSNVQGEKICIQCKQAGKTYTRIAGNRVRNNPILPKEIVL